MSALIQKATFGRPMDIPWIRTFFGYLMDNPQDVQWIENAIWVGTNVRIDPKSVLWTSNGYPMDSDILWISNGQSTGRRMD